MDEYHRMGEAGIIPAGRRVELINGEIIEMSPINSPHAGTVKLLNQLLGKILEEKAVIGIQDPVVLDEHSEPEPDLTILKFREDFYTNAHPETDDVLFLIEVADSSVRDDRREKIPLYAAAGIPEVWIVSLPDRQIEIYTQPANDGYSQINIYRKGDVIEASLIEALPVDHILIQT